MSIQEEDEGQVLWERFMEKIRDSGFHSVEQFDEQTE
jgi:hypothetical protein